MKAVVLSRCESGPVATAAPVMPVAAAAAATARGTEGTARDVLLPEAPDAASRPAPLVLALALLLLLLRSRPRADVSTLPTGFCGGGLSASPAVGPLPLLLGLPAAAGADCIGYKRAQWLSPLSAAR